MYSLKTRSQIKVFEELLPTVPIFQSNIITPEPTIKAMPRLSCHLSLGERLNAGIIVSNQKCVIMVVFCLA